jgi:hypothetical protein
VAEAIARPNVVVEPHPEHEGAWQARCMHCPTVYGPSVKTAVEEAARHHRADHRAGKIDLETGWWVR